MILTFFVSLLFLLIIRLSFSLFIPFFIGVHGFSSSFAITPNLGGDIGVSQIAIPAWAKQEFGLQKDISYVTINKILGMSEKFLSMDKVDLEAKH